MEILTHKNILNNICLQKKELYIHIKDIGFAFLLDNKMKAEFNLQMQQNSD